MTGVRWVRLDAGFPHNPKILQLATDGRWRAIVLYASGLAYAGQQGSEGHIPRTALHLIHGRPADAAQLVDAGLWEVNGNGWNIHDWHDYQPTNQVIEARTRSERARHAAEVRWHGTK